MKYVIQNEQGVLEIREDQYTLQPNAIELTDAQCIGLLEGTLTVIAGAVVPLTA